MRKNDLPHLEIDARLTIFSKFYLDQYNVLNKELTFYVHDFDGITSKIKKFSKIWWIRRNEGYIYLKYIMKKKKILFKASIDYYITFILALFFRVFP